MRKIFALTFVVALASGVLLGGSAVAAPPSTISPGTFPSGTVGTSYTQEVIVTGRRDPYTVRVTRGALPGGLSLTASGALSGTPSSAGTFAFTISAFDSSGGDADAVDYSIVIAPAFSVSPSSLPAATVGTAYTQSIDVTGPSAPYTVEVTQGALPSGISLSSSGTLAGTPTASGTFGFTVSAYSSGGTYAGYRDYALSVAASVANSTISIGPSSLLAATVGATYSQSIAVTGASAPYTVKVTQGSLPGGLSLASDGTLGGNPTTSGTFGFTVSAYSSGGTYAGYRDYTLSVAAAVSTFSISPSTLPAATAGSAYSTAIGVTGVNGPYSVRLSLGVLPAGLSLSSAGLLSGTPTTSGTYGLTISAFDVLASYAGFRDYTLTVNAAAPSDGAVSGTTTFSDDFEGTLQPAWIASGDPSQFAFTAGYTGQGYSITDFSNSAGPNASSQLSALWFSSNAQLAAASQGNDTWYSMRLYLPSNYQATTGHWNWLAEWHDDNTTMNACPGAVSVAVGVYTDYPVVTNAYGNNPRLALRLAGGNCSSPQLQSFELPSNSLQRAHWYDLRFHFVWSTSSSTGLAEWWVDGQQQLSTQFPTLYTRSDGSPSWNSFGLYNYRLNASWTATVQYDRIRIGTTPSAVQ